MLPCRIFLQKLQLCPPPSNSSYKPNLSLTLNSIYYDQIKPFQTKYFCLTVHDVVAVQATIKQSQVKGDGDGRDSNECVGRVVVENVYKLAVEGKVVEIKIKTKGCEIKEINLCLLVEPVLTFRRQILGNTGQLKNIDKLLNQNQSHNQDTNNQLDVSFSQKSAISPIQVNTLANFTKDWKFKERDTYQDRYRDVPLFSDTSKSYPEEAESLESLAQQRERILGELFGRFKPIK